MKKIMKHIFLLCLVYFSFFYTDKVIEMINKKDPLMMKIINLKSEYDIQPVNAIMKDDTIIPGVKGREIDITKSYDNMKIGGIFREDALIFNDLYPSSSLYKNKKKYIIKGSTTKKEVSLIYIFNSNNIDKIIELENITLFINHSDLNIKNIKKLKEKEIYTYGNKGIYSNEILINDNSLINNLSNNKSKYCLLKEKDNNTLNLCNENNMYTIIPNIIGGYYEVQKNLSNGSIILLNNINDIDNITRYIYSKGYNIVGLNVLISE